MNLILIDDETKTRRGLMEHVDWFALGFTSVKAAAGAREALALCEHWIPAVVISDVRMPEMDGPELCRRLRAIAPDCQLLFISGYEDVESLRAAIDLSAVSFLHKPFGLAELESKTRLALQRYSENRRSRDVRETLFRNRQAIAQDTLARLIHGRREENVSENLRMLGLDERKTFQVVLVKACQTAEVSLCNRLHGALAQACPSAELLQCRPDDALVLFLLARPRGQSEAASAAENAELAENIRAFSVSEHRVLCAVSRPLDDAERLDEAFADTQAQLEALFWGEYGETSFSLDLQGEGDGGAVDLSAFEDAVSQADGALAVKRMNELCARLRLREHRRIATARKAYRRMASIVCQAAERLQPDADGEAEPLLLAEMDGVDTLSALNELLCQRLNLVFQPDERFGDVNRTVWQTINYIKEHLEQPDLSVVELAEQVYLTPTYLSGLFKRETGQTVGQMILQMRMERARELLRDPSLKLYRVSELCGYQDPNYFAKLFKKATGVSPSKYRESRK